MVEKHYYGRRWKMRLMLQRASNGTEQTLYWQKLLILSQMSHKTTDCVNKRLHEGCAKMSRINLFQFLLPSYPRCCYS